MIINDREYKTAVAYYRVSTGKQQRHGTSLTTQQQDVKSFAAARGLTIIEEYNEARSGTGKRRRPAFDAAVREARKHDAVLLIAKLDRLARNTYIFSKLQQENIPFIAVDMPEANSMVIGFMALLAEYESKQISKRVSRAWKYKRSQDPDFVPGSTKGITDEMRKQGAAANREAATKHQHQIYSIVKVMRDQGKGWKTIARFLNEQGHKTRGNAKHPPGDFYPLAVRRIYERGLPNLEEEE